MRYGILVLYFLLALLVVGLAVGATIAERANRLEDARAQSLSLSRALEQQVAGLIGSASQYLIGTRVVIENNDGLDHITTERLQRILQAQLLQGGAIRKALLFDANGILKNVGSSPFMGPVDFSERKWFRAARDSTTREVIVHLPLRSIVDRHWVIPLTARIDNADGTFGGVVAVSLEADYLVEFYRSLGFASDSVIALILEDGTYLMRYPDFESVAGTKVRAENLAHFSGNEGSLDSLLGADKALRVASYRKVAGQPMYVVIGISREKVFGVWERNTWMRFYGTVLVLVLLTLFTVVLLRRLDHERAAILSLQHFKDAVDRSGDLVFWVTAEGRFVYVNDTAGRRLGYTREQITVLSVADVAPEFPRERWTEFWLQLREAGETRVTTAVRTRDGSLFPFGLSASYVQIDGEDYAFAIGRDLSDERRNEAAVQALNATLEQRVRERTAELAEIAREFESFSYAVSHDLRAPLRHLSGFVQILSDLHGSQLTDDARALCKRIADRARYMNDLIEGLLKLSQISRSPLHTVPLDLTAMAESLAEELQRDAPNREVSVFIARDMRAEGDPALVRTLLQNLLGNAWKYSSKVEHARVEMRSEIIGEELAYIVKDNGVGFDTRFASRLFGAFQRLHSESEFGGTGIGLATARRIVERHGGRIWAEAAPGEGATFFFTLRAPALADETGGAG